MSSRPKRGTVRRVVIVSSPAKDAGTSHASLKRTRKAKEDVADVANVQRSPSRPRAAKRTPAPRTPSPRKAPVEAGDTEAGVEAEVQSPVLSPVVLPPLVRSPIPDLESLRRPQVQVIAKKLGIRANQATSSLVAQVNWMIMHGEVTKHNVDKRRHEGSGRDLYEASERRGRKRKLSIQIVGRDEEKEEKGPEKKKRRLTD